jgi:hypothetical protein
MYPPAPAGAAAPGSQPYNQNASGASLRTSASLPYTTPAPTERDFKGGRLLALANKGKPGLAWPLGLEILPPALETKALRDQIDKVSDTLLEELQAGRSSPSLVSQLKEDVDELQALMRERGDFLPVSDQAIEQASHFLHRLRAAVQDLR